MPSDRWPDPETLLLTAIIGAVIGSVTAVGSLLAADLAEQLGPKLESPPIIAKLYRALRESL